MDLMLKDIDSPISLSEQVFGREYNEALIHQVVVAYMSNGRQGTQSQKTRSEVSGGGKKPWKQKGSGRARAGTIRSPIWRGGGVTFAAKPRTHEKKINKKMYSGALKSILSELVRQDRLVVVDKFDVADHKTKSLVNKLKESQLDNVLIIQKEVNENLSLASRNIPNVLVIDTTQVNPVDMISFEKVLLTKEAIKEIEGVLL